VKAKTVLCVGAAEGGAHPSCHQLEWSQALLLIGSTANSEAKSRVLWISGRRTSEFFFWSFKRMGSINTEFQRLRWDCFGTVESMLLLRSRRTFGFGSRGRQITSYLLTKRKVVKFG
jgi:hypothetical protein